jgi:hypothetical protein
MNDGKEQTNLKKKEPEALPIWKIVLHFCWGFTIGFLIGG